MLSIVWFTIGFALVAALYTGLMFKFWAIGFVLLLAGASYAALGGYTVASLRSFGTINRRPTLALFNIIVSVIALLGLWAMFYDRTEIRGIDYVNLGIAAARAEFNRVGERGGVNMFRSLNRAENVSVKDGHLRVAVRQEMIGGHLVNTGGGIISKHQFGYGYYECRSTPFMSGHGVHSAFWQAGGAPGKVRPLDVEAERVDRAARLRDHLRPHPVAGEESDPVAQAGAPTLPGTLSR